MKNHWIAFYLIVLFSVPEAAFSQDLPDVIPPSPEAASFGKFSEVPVSLHTGVANISVPIASYSVGDKTFPVSIDYHGRGIQVSEIASKVGLGWALNAGGAVIRQTRGLADDITSYGYLSGGNMLIEALRNDTYLTDYSVRQNINSVENSTQKEFDRVSDVYTIQIGNLNAKFILNYKDNQPLLQSFQDLEIDIIYNSGKIGGFKVIDSEGYIYYFGISKAQIHQPNPNEVARDSDYVNATYSFPEIGSYSSVSPSNYEETYNTWHIMNIESPTGDIVNFHYSPAPQATEFFRRSYDDQDRLSGDVVAYATKLTSYQYQLERIEHRGGEISLTDYSTPRQDLKNATALHKVEIKDHDQNLVKYFELYQSYLTSIADNNYHSQLVNLEPEAAKRLFLDSIVEFGQNHGSKPPYKFTYNAELLPNRHSNSQDLWGYYNGKNNGRFLTFFNYNNKVINRTVDVEKSKAGLLEKITYPTGGSTKLYYGHNEGELGDEFSDVLLPDTNPIQTYSANIGHLNFGGPQNLWNASQYRYEKTFIIDQKLFAFPTVNIWFGDPSKCSSSVVTGNCDFRVYLSGNGNYFELLMGNSSVANVQPGQYTLIVEPQHLNHNPIDIMNNPHHAFGVSFTWKISENNGNFIYGPGKRIEKVETYSSDDRLETVKEYKYENMNGEKSGIIFSVGGFHTIDKYLSNGTLVVEAHGAEPGSPFSTYQGNSIGYSDVIEYNLSGFDDSGKTHHVFTAYKDSGEAYRFPHHAPCDNSFIRGLPLEKSFFKNENGQYKLVSKTVNEFGFPNNDLMSLYTLHANYFSTENALTPNPYSDLVSRSYFRLPMIRPYLEQVYNFINNTTELKSAYKVYVFTGGVINTLKSTNTSYDDNENPALVTTTETEFNYSNHYKPVNIITSTSDGKSMIQKYKYPQDDPTSFAALNAAHIFEPVEVTTYKDRDIDKYPDTNERLSITQTEYGASGQPLKPSKIKVGKGTNNNDIEERIEFIKYDDRGNLLQARKSDGTNITYIYGYNKTLPIAKIENATYSQVSSQVSNLQKKSNLDDDHCRNSGSCDEKNLRTALNNLRKSLPNAMVTTYTYDPLIGVTSMTDPRGMIVYYEYDEFGRLSQTLDEDGKILTETEYQYGQ
jgi:YD repeat-containing protein